METPEIREQTPAWLPTLATVSIAFDVDRILRPVLQQGGLGGIALVEEPVAVPWRKDYDRLPDNHPTLLPQQFDLSRWGFLSAHVGGPLVGGAVVAFGTPEIHLLADHPERAVLWDLRVAPEARGRGIGTTLFSAVERWAAARGARARVVETQNINVGACRFYAGRGCGLAEIRRFAYPDFPEEVQLVWEKGFERSSGADASL